MDNGFFDKLQDAVMIAGKEVKDAASDFSEKAKLKYEIHTRESYLNELYMELGKKYYAEHKDDDHEDEDGPDRFEEIENLLSEINDLREELNNKKGAMYCPRCGAQLPKDADYCSRCGAFLHED